MLQCGSYSNQIMHDTYDMMTRVTPILRLAGCALVVWGGSRGNPIEMRVCFSRCNDKPIYNMHAALRLRDTTAAH